MKVFPKLWGAGPSTDRDALMAFYRSTGGSGWSKSDGWGTDARLGDWWGVEVDGRRRVVSLSLVANDLTGAIPRELGQLANREFLELGSNDLTGTIPSELGDLAELTSRHCTSAALHSRQHDQKQVVCATRCRAGTWRKEE